MTLLWAVPPMAVAVGALLAMAQLHQIAAAAADLRAELGRFREVQVAVEDLRRAVSGAQGAVRALRRD